MRSLSFAIIAASPKPAKVSVSIPRQVCNLHDNGATNDEIAEAVDRGPRAVRALAATRGVLIS